MPKKNRPGNTTLIGISLVHTDIRFGLTDLESENIAYSFDVTIDLPQEYSDGKFSFSVEYSISKFTTEKNDGLTGFSAIYYCGLQTQGVLSEEDILLSAKNHAKTTIWSHFSSLCALVTNQMRTEFPPLPPTPNHINIKKEDNDSTTETHSDFNQDDL